MIRYANSIISQLKSGKYLRFYFIYGIIEDRRCKTKQTAERRRKSSAHSCPKKASLLRVFYAESMEEFSFRINSSSSSAVFIINVTLHFLISIITGRPVSLASCSAHT